MPDVELKHEIKRAVSGLLSEEGTVRIVCPNCGGGSSKEKSMAVSHSDRGVGFCCFRDKCGVRGYLTGSVTFGNGQRKESKTPKLSITAMPEEVHQHLPVKNTSVAPMWEYKRQMVLYPVLSYWGSELGYVQRYYSALNDWWSGPKAINIPHDPNSNYPFLHFPMNVQEKFDGSLVLVEDWPSAEAVAQHQPACALLGTNLSSTELGHLLQIGVRHLKICLDNDALHTAAILKRKVSLLFDEVEVVFVDKDPKDMSDDELRGKFYVD